MPSGAASFLGYANSTVSSIQSTIELTQAGAQYGHLAIPYSYNLGGWANLQVPIASLRNGDGPVVLLMAGNHGDEYPGQVAILRLIRGAGKVPVERDSFYATVRAFDAESEMGDVDVEAPSGAALAVA